MVTYLFLTSFCFLASSKLPSNDLRSSFVCSMRLLICFTSLRAFLISLLMYLLPSVDNSVREEQGGRARREEETSLGTSWVVRKAAGSRGCQGLETPGRQPSVPSYDSDIGSTHKAHCGPRVRETQTIGVGTPHCGVNGAVPLPAGERACPAIEENFKEDKS